MPNYSGPPSIFSKVITSVEQTANVLLEVLRFIPTLFSAAIDGAREALQPNLSHPNLRYRFTDETDGQSPELDHLRAISDQMTALYEVGDWVSIAGQIEIWDQDRTKSPSGTALAKYAVEQITALTSIKIPNDHQDCAAMENPIVDEATLDLLELQAATHLKLYVLKLLNAHLRDILCFPERNQQRRAPAAYN